MQARRRGVGAFDRFDRTRPPSTQPIGLLTTSIQSLCVAITAWVEAISLSGPAFWLEFKKNCLWCVAWTILQRRGKMRHKLIQIPYH